MEPFLRAEDATLDVRKVLAELLALVGEDVEVTIGAANGEPRVVAMLKGELLRAANLAVNLSLPEREEQFFILREGDTSGFLVEAASFRGGGS